MFHIGPYTLCLTQEKHKELLDKRNKKEIETKKVLEEKKLKQKLKDESNEMASHWPDSFANIKTREAEKRKAIKKIREELWNKQGEYYKDYHRKERKQFLEDIGKKIMMNNQPNIALSKALFNVHIRAENEAVINHKKEVKEQELKIEKDLNDKTCKKNQDDEKKEYEKKCQNLKTAKSIQLFQLTQIEEKQNRHKKKQAEKIREERKDLQRIFKEINDRKDTEIENLRNMKKSMTETMKLHFAEKKKERHMLEKQDRELLEVNSIYKENLDKRGCCIRKQCMEAINESINQKFAMTLEYRKRLENAKNVENGISRKTSIDKDKLYELKQEKELRKKEKVCIERRENYLQNQQKIEEKSKVEKEMLRFQIGDRLKFLEKIKEYDEEKRKIDKRKRIEFGKELKNQMEEKNEKDSPKTNDELYKIQDERFFKYAKEVLDHVNTLGYNDYPIRNEIKTYCKKNILPICSLVTTRNESHLSKICSSRDEIKLPKINITT